MHTADAVATPARPRSSCVVCVVLLAALVAPGCGAAEAPAPLTLMGFVAENGAGRDYFGDWRLDGLELRVGWSERADFELELTKPGDPGAKRLSSTARDGGGVLLLHDPIDGIELLYRCDVDGRNVLFAVPGTELVDGKPSGRVFERVSTRRRDMPPFEKPEKPIYLLPGPHDEVAPMRRGGER